MTGALATTDEQKPPADRRISRRVRDAVDLLVLGDAKTIKDAAEQVGMSREALSRALSKDHVKSYRDARLALAIEGLEVLSLGQLRQLLLNSDSDHVKKDIALKVLQRRIGGDQAAAVQINVTPGYVIDLSGTRSPSEPVTIDAKPLQDKAESEP